MFDFHEKRKIRRVIYSKVTIAFLFLIALVIGRSVYERFSIEREMATKLEDRVGQLDLLKQRAALLEGKVKHLQNERGIEEEIRSRFDVAKEGEQVVIILDDVHDVDAAPVPAEPNIDTQEQKSFLDVLKFW